MGYNSSTGILSAPISTGDISDALDYNSRDLGVLIKQGEINKWAKHKPVRSDKILELTSQELAYANFGFRVSTATEGGIEYKGIQGFSVSEVFANASANNGVWPYIIPRGISYNEWFRTLDFDGYNKNAILPYECFCPKAYNVRSVSVQIFDMAFEGAEIALTDMIGLSRITDTGRSIEDWRLGLAWRKGSTGNINVIYHDSVLADCFDDPDGEGGREIMSFTPTEDGAYLWCVFITDYDPEDDPSSGNTYKYVYLPGGFGGVEISTSGGGDIIPPAQEPVRINLDEIGVTGSPYVTGLEFDFTVESSNEYEVEITVDLFNESNYPLKSGSDSVETVSSEEYAYPNITGINFLDNYETTDVFARISYRYRQGTGNWTNRYYDPVTGQVATTIRQAYSIDSIIEAIDEDNV